MGLCIDCKHFGPSSSGDSGGLSGTYACYCKSIGKIDPITGKIDHKHNGLVGFDGDTDNSIIRQNKGGKCEYFRETNWWIKFWRGCQ